MQVPFYVRRGATNPEWNDSANKVNVVEQARRWRDPCQYVWITTKDVDLVCAIIRSVNNRSPVFFVDMQLGDWTRYNNEETAVLVWHGDAPNLYDQDALFMAITTDTVIGFHTEGVSDITERKKPASLLCVVVSDRTPQQFFERPERAVRVYETCTVYTLDATQVSLHNDPLFRPVSRTHEDTVQRISPIDQGRSQQRIVVTQPEDDRARLHAAAQQSEVVPFYYRELPIVQGYVPGTSGPAADGMQRVIGWNADHEPVLLGYARIPEGVDEDTASPFAEYVYDHWDDV